MAALSTPLCMVCKEHFNSERPVMMLVGCACSERMCKICSETFFKDGGSSASCPNCRVAVTKIVIDRFLANAFNYTLPEDVHEVALQVIAPVSPAAPNQTHTSKRKDPFKKAERIYKKKGMEEAEKYFKISAQAGNDEAYYRLGRWYHESLDVFTYTKGIEYLKTSADMGNLEAMYRLFQIYSKGDKAPKDPRAAGHYLQSAASKQHLESVYKLGELFLNGEIFDLDIDLGISLIKQAADGGITDAQFLLACIYGGRSQNSLLFHFKMGWNPKLQLNRYHNYEEALRYFEMCGNSKPLSFMILAEACYRPPFFFPSLSERERYQLGLSYCLQAKELIKPGDDLYGSLCGLEIALENCLTRLDAPAVRTDLPPAERYRNGQKGWCQVM